MNDKQRDQFEVELAQHLTKFFPATSEHLLQGLRHMRDGDRYTSDSVTGRMMAIQANAAWWAWQRSRAALVEEVMGELPELDEDADQSKEHAIQNRIRNALAGKALIFRANVGQAWTGSSWDRLPGGRSLIHDARPFSTGLPPGFSDLFGGTPVTVTQEMVGSLALIFTALEVKTAKGKPTEKQAAFIKAVNDNGGRADVVRSPEDAVRVVEGGQP